MNYLKLNKLIFLKKSIRSVLNYCTENPCCSPPNSIVSLLDISCPLSENLAMMLMQNPRITELRLCDETKDSCGIAEDLRHIDTGVKVISYKCSLMIEAIKGSNILICAGGCQNKPEECDDEIFKRNADNVRQIALLSAEFNPDAIFCIATPPIDALVPMEYKKNNRYDPRKIIGIASFSSMLSNHFVSEQLSGDPAMYFTPIVGGLTSRTAVAVVSNSKPNMTFKSEDEVIIQSNIENAEEDVVVAHCESHCQGCMLNLSRALAISRFINSVLKALQEGQLVTENAYIRQTGHIEAFLPYMASIVKLDSKGISSSHMPQLNVAEEAKLKSVVPAILQNIQMGEQFVNSDLQMTNRTCDIFIKRKLKEINKDQCNTDKCLE